MERSVYFFLHLLSFLLMLQHVSAGPSLPNVTLPWGIWQANSIDPSTNIYSFQNVRFGKPPNGTYRFKKSERPDPSLDILSHMNNSYGPTCHQVALIGGCQNAMPVEPSSEDCLFLDVYVPKSIWDAAQSGKHSASTPVVVWFYGGAYEFGAKSAYGPGIPFYNGTGVMSSAQSNYSADFIFVTGNYRLGAFGWLAGSTMEKKGLPNAGLYDQRLLLEWVQDFIHLFGGNRSHVSAWGESAGASSIMHHLLAFEGTQDPLFQYAFVQSPAFEWSWNNSAGGTLDQVFDNFTLQANCSQGDFDCLVNSTEEVLVTANQNLYLNDTNMGIFPVGPAVDGTWITELPQIAYKKGKVWKDLATLVVSHVDNEAKNFVPGYVSNWDTSSYYTFLENFFPGTELANVRNRINNNSNYNGDFTWDDVEDIIQDSSFVCNTRFMFDTYSQNKDTNVYAMYYSFLDSEATHTSDLLPTFYNPSFDVASFLTNYVCIDSTEASGYASYMVSDVVPTYQAYLADLAVYGDPNFHPKTVNWSTAALTSDGNSVNNTLFVGSPWNDVTFWLDKDGESTWVQKCGFWMSIAEEINSLMQAEKRAAKVDKAASGQQYLVDELKR